MLTNFHRLYSSFRDRRPYKQVRLGLLSVSFTLLATNIFRVMTNSSSWACLIDFISDFAIGAGPIAGAFFTAQERAASQVEFITLHFSSSFGGIDIHPPIETQFKRLTSGFRDRQGTSVKAARPKIQVEIKSKREVFCQSKVTAIDAEPLTEGQATTVTYRSSNT
ncbi:hypothetical protein PGT21_000897 [Puccinia graminis f. sp. tritici]|uniref:Uncharacterized protein n=1 Tax=Puccinia graminis f. sp. tritici TaxID=56615 RepID=A0A5B0PCG0_PUCGR|nr:hypothetical protein PGT21_000897 [Puccinia graminis f. sp. tritici]